MYPEKEVENWRCNGVYGKKARYHFTAGKRPEEELKTQFTFEEPGGELRNPPARCV